MEGFTWTPEFKARWVAALRSGKYEQGQKGLKVDNTFCCMGVACDLIDPTRWTAEGQCWDFEGEGEPFDFGGIATTSNPGIVDRDSENKLVNMNDVVGRDFNFIADWIEANL